MIFGSVRIESFVHPNESPRDQPPKYISINSDIKSKVLALYKIWLDVMLTAHSRAEKIQSTFKILGMESDYEVIAMLSATTIQVDSTRIYYSIAGQFQLGMEGNISKKAMKLVDMQAPFEPRDITYFEQNVSKFCELFEMDDDSFKDKFNSAMITRELPLAYPKNPYVY